MYHRERRKIFITLLIASCIVPIAPKSIASSEKPTFDSARDNFENNIIDFDEDHSLKFNKKYGIVPWESSEKFNKETHRYTLIKDKNATGDKNNVSVQNDAEVSTIASAEQSTLDNDYSVIPLELVSTTEDALISIIESTTEYDLTVIPLSTTQKVTPAIVINETITLPTSTENSDSTTEYELNDKIISESDKSETTTIKRDVTHDKNNADTVTETALDVSNFTSTIKIENPANKTKPNTMIKRYDTNVSQQNNTNKNTNQTKIREILKTNSSVSIEIFHPDSSESQEDAPSFSELDASDQSDVPEDYYDNKDVLPTTAPKTDALSVIFGVAGSLVESVVESVAERVVPKSIYDLFKRMQKQSEALEAERLRSREENGGLGQFGRGILKSISSGLSKPLSQLMQGVKDIGSLDNDRGFVSSVASGVASGVTSVATSVSDAFKDRVQAIYPGTVWCGDGHSATARSSDLGLFFFTDTCCRQHDACKIYIRSGDTKYGLTNTGLFTRSHCSCDAKFRDCLRKTNSLVSAQIGLTYFNVLGPQCFRKAHPIIKCVKRTRITGQKCEEYELDNTKPKMWQWFDNETF